MAKSVEARNRKLIGRTVRGVTNELTELDAQSPGLMLTLTAAELDDDRRQQLPKLAESYDGINLSEKPDEYKITPTSLLEILKNDGLGDSVTPAVSIIEDISEN
ncbi:MAG: hypothetical protein COU69_04195 [Candidatus Pacebacteria bacterium CG10_big_fil_rev_8_21_14_0_10_56_10]|nr:MAG: hypothetical protein COU69_04195 [Candidatus Pacebacteria bacterium CG10_big_fil_rev_8_21_14_0_10_56_10]